MRRKSLQAGYTVEAAGVMAVVLMTIMVLMSQAFRIHAEVAGKFALHETAERMRHQIEKKDERDVTVETKGNGWELEITAPVFRPEETMRLWSLTEEKQ